MTHPQGSYSDLDKFIRTNTDRGKGSLPPQKLGTQIEQVPRPNTITNKQEFNFRSNPQLISTSHFDRSSGATTALERVQEEQTDRRTRMSYQEFLKPEFGESVIDKIDKIGKVKLSTDTLRDEERHKLKVKTVVYLGIEATILLIVLWTLVNYLDEWKSCKVHYFAWIVNVGAFSGVSLILNAFTYRQIIQKRFKVWLVAASTILEAGMVILALFSIIMIFNASTCLSKREVQYTTFTLAFVMFLRSFQTILVIFFLCCCMPCYCFQDDCFVKKRLINKRKCGPEVHKQIPNWTWVYKSFTPGESKEGKAFDKDRYSVYDPSDRCFICFQNFERGMQVTFLPCNISKEIRNRNTLQKFGTSHASTTTGVFSERPYRPLESYQGDKILRSDSLLSTGEAGIDRAHVLHYHCISNWLKQQNKCPVCHSAVTEATFDLPERDELPEKINELLAYIDQLKRESRLITTGDDKDENISDEQRQHQQYENREFSIRVHADPMLGMQRRARFTYTSEATSLVTDNEIRGSKNTDEAHAFQGLPSIDNDNAAGLDPNSANAIQLRSESIGEQEFKSSIASGSKQSNAFGSFQ